MALNTIIENIREKNRFPVGGFGLESLTMSTDGQKLALVRSEDHFTNGKGSIWVWDLAGTPLWHCAIPATGFATFDFDASGNKVVLKPWSSQIQVWDSSCQPAVPAPGDTLLIDRRRGTFAKIGADGLTRIIDSSNKVIGQYQSGTADVPNVRCHPSSELTLVSDSSGRVQKLNTSGFWTDFYRSTRQGFQDFDITPDGQFVVIEYHGGEFVLLDLAAKEVAAWKTQDAQHRLWMSPKETLLATYSSGKIHLWSPPGELRGEFKISKMVTDVQFTPDGSRVIVTDFDTVRFFANTGEPLYQLSGHQGAITRAFVTPDSQRAITGGVDSTVRLWDLSDRSARRLDGGTHSRILAVSFRKGRDDVVVIDGTGNVTLWSREGERMSSWHAGSNPERATISPDERYMALAYSSGIQVWDVAGHTAVNNRLLTANRMSTLQMAFSPNSQVLAVSRPGGSIELLALSSSTDARSPTESWVYGLAFDPSGRKLAAALPNSVLLFFDLNAKQSGRVETGHSHLLDVTFSHDGRYLATAGADGTIGLWTAAGRPVRTLYGHTARALSVRFSPDSQLIAGAGEDQTVRVWDVNGRPLATLDAPVRSLTSESQGGGFIGPPLAFSPDSKYVALGGDDGVTRIWSIDTLDTLLARGQGWLLDHMRTSNLTVR
jgi:WD40 repeat protein